MEKKQRVKKPAVPKKVEVETDKKPFISREEGSILRAARLIAENSTYGMLGGKLPARSMQDIANLISIDTDTITWEEAKKALNEGKCVHCTEWPEGEFLFLRKGNVKYVNADSVDAMFYQPITLEFLKKREIKQFVIGKHLNRWRTGNSLQVGYVVPHKEQMSNWRIYNP